MRTLSLPQHQQIGLISRVAVAKVITTYNFSTIGSNPDEKVKEPMATSIVAPDLSKPVLAIAHDEKRHAHRQFYDFAETSTPVAEIGTGDGKTFGQKRKSKSAIFRGNSRELLEMVDRNLIGRETVFQGPFGLRRSVYMDHTASGQPLRCIEEYIRDHVLPYYGNTHTTTTLTSSQSTMYRHEARDIIRNSVGASEHDAVIFCGSGSTGAIHKIVHSLAGDFSKPRPVVFVGPYEHHSNLLPWRDVGAKMVNIPERPDGLLDMEYLEDRLKEAVAERVEGRYLIGAFSVASNITGIPTNDIALTVLMHKYNGLALWDYSAAAPHVQIVMNPVVLSTTQGGSARKDAIYFSGHKFVGGPQTPGVLVVKKSLLENISSSVGGGGTVFFVTSDSHRYLKSVEFREEGGTPAIVESIRLGLVFRLKDTIGYQNIISREAIYTKKTLDDWSKISQIKVLGPKSVPRVPIISFLIEHPQTGYYLHYNFVVALLNDLFGIQSRGGCACAGPYGQDLLGIDVELAHTYENLLLEDCRLDRAHLRRQQEGSTYEIFRPGFTRISIPYYASLQEAEYVSEAIKLVAEHGWRLLPLYTFKPETGEFHHHVNYLLTRRLWLSNATFDAEGIRSKERTRNNSEDYPNYKECLEQARNIFSNAHSLCKRRILSDQSLLFDSSISHLRWFLLPSESKDFLNEEPNCETIKSPRPFQVKSYTTKKDFRSSNYEALSVPQQIMQSAWTSLDHSKKSHQHRLRSSGSGSDLNSSGNDSDNELHIPGATVTGPSICFSGSLNTRKDPVDMTVKDSSVMPKPESSFVSVKKINSNVSPMDSIPQFEMQRQDEIAALERNHSTSALGIVSTADNSCFLQSIPINSSLDQNQVTGQNYVNGNYTASELQAQGQPIYSQNHSITSSVYDTQELNNGMNNLNLSNRMVIPTSPTTNCAYCCPNIVAGFQSYSPTPSYNNFQQPMGQIQFQNFNGDGGLRYNNEHHLNHSGFSPGSQCQSPVPSQMSQLNFQGQYQETQGTYRGQGEFFQQSSPIPFNIQQSRNESPQGIRPLKTSVSVDSPSSESPVSNEELVNIAMRRVTNEIANELKSEIREVISQVEQGIDPDGVRERANSFNTRHDPRVENLKKRTRTLSGQMLYGIRRHNSEDPTFTFKESPRLKKIESTVEAAAVPNSPVSMISTSISDVTRKLPKKMKDVTGPTWHCPPKGIIKPTLTAINEFSMINDGDRILVCLSGGKDSLTLLHTMKQMQFIMKKAGKNFSLGAVTVDPGSSAYNPRPLIPYLEALGLPYFFEEQGIMPAALEMGPSEVSSICSFCSRLKRGRIYATAREQGYNVLAFGQHLDDLAESFFMSAFHNGLLRTMKAAYTVKEGDLRVIRPFTNVREKALREFAESSGLPIIPENCPACFEAPTERHRVKQLLAQQEILFPKLFVSLRAAMHPLMAINKTGMESSLRSRKMKNIDSTKDEAGTSDKFVSSNDMKQDVCDSDY